MAQDITIPDLGDFKDVEVIDVLVKAGDTIEVDTPLLTLETEKATLDVPSTVAGVIRSLAISKGDRVSQGTVIAQVDVAQGKAASGEAPPSAAAGSPPGAVPAGDRSAQTASQAPAAQAPEVVPATSTPGLSTSAPDGSGQGASSQRSSATTPTQAGTAGQAAAGQDTAGQDTAGQDTAEQGHAPAPMPVIDEAGFARAYASPSVRRFARELGVNLAEVKGTGLKGRITPQDVKGWVKQALSAGTAASASGSALPKIPQIDYAQFGAIESQPLGRIAKISGPRLQASWLNIPHVWQMDEADITEMEAARGELKEKAAQAGIKLTPLAFILRACVLALREFPAVNSSLDSANQALVLKRYLHLGFAADTPGGLVVPVIRNADRMDVYELARELATLSEKARQGKLSAAEMQGASFTVSSLGGIGGTSFTPIINAPEVAILGVARSSMKPVWQDGQFVPRLILPFTFAYDHRVIDGAAGARFTSFLARKLADVKGLLEAVP